MTGPTTLHSSLKVVLDCLHDRYSSLRFWSCFALLCCMSCADRLLAVGQPCKGWRVHPGLTHRALVSRCMTTVSTLAAAVTTPALTRLLVGTLVPVDTVGLLVSTLQARI